MKISKSIFGLLVCVASCCLPLGCSTLTPPAGSYSEVLLVTDSGEASEWDKTLGPLIAPELDYYVDTEKQFRITSVRAADMEAFPAFKNIVICGVLETSTDVGQRILNLIGDAGVQEVRQQGARFLKQEDRPATNQFTLIVTAPSEAELREVIAEQGWEIPDILEKSCRERLRRFLLKDKNEKLSAELATKYGFELQIPSLYRRLRDEPNPNGVEIIREPPTRLLGVFWTDWKTAPTMADQDTLFAIRANYVWEHYDKDQMDRERVVFEPARLGRYDAIRMSGYWFNDEEVLGGYYETYFIFDEGADLLWAVDLLVLAPGKPKQPLVRELQAIAETIRFM